METKKKRAIISVSDKTGVVGFAQCLNNLGFEIISTGGTARELKENNVPVILVSEVTEFPEILGGRVKTLHPDIAGAILATNSDADQAQLKEHGITPIQVVCVNLYPFGETVAKLGVSLEQALEEVDIGGVTLLREAAKNHNNGVVVVADLNDYDLVINEMKANNGEVSDKLRLCLANKTFDLTKRYDAAIEEFLAKQMNTESISIFGKSACRLAYAENRNQNPADLFAVSDADPLAMHKFKVLSGDPSYISIADGSRMLEVLCIIAEAFRKCKGRIPYIVVAGKHGNPCGAAIDWDDPAIAIRKALLGDPLAVMGGEFVANFAIRKEYGQLLYEVPNDLIIGRPKWGLDIVYAPDFAEEAVDLLGERAKRRLLKNEALFNPTLPPDKYVYKSVRSGVLRQSAYPFILTPDSVESWTNEVLSEKDFESLIIAWACCWKASSNTVALAKDRMLISLGCGQQDRIACVKLCLSRAKRSGHEIKGSVFASDAFFPYATSSAPDVSKLDFLPEAVAAALAVKNNNPNEVFAQLSELAGIIEAFDKREGPELLIAAGCIGGVVPADGNKLEEVRNLFTTAGLSVAFVNKVNRGFSQH